eukprot:scaffold10175_cov268-Chaetoceros_neogracile.AAC.27
MPMSVKDQAYWPKEITLATAILKPFLETFMLWMKGTIEELRSKNSFGTLIWQMNDNWRSGGWGILEYDGHLDDIGRWKPLMYLLQRSLFRDVFATCGASIDGIAGSCYIRNDGVAQFDGNLLVEKWSFSGETTCVVIRVLNEYNEDKMGQNLVLWKLPKQLNGLANDPGIILNSVVVEADGRLTLTLETKQVALYICLASSIHGDFDDNAFSMPAGSTRMVRFSPSLQYLAGKNLEKAFEESLRIDHLGMSWTDLKRTASSSFEEVYIPHDCVFRSTAHLDRIPDESQRCENASCFERCENAACLQVVILLGFGHIQHPVHLIVVTTSVVVIPPREGIQVYFRKPFIDFDTPLFFRTWKDVLSTSYKPTIEVI